MTDNGALLHLRINNITTNRKSANSAKGSKGKSEQVRLDNGKIS